MASGNTGWGDDSVGADSQTPSPRGTAVPNVDYKNRSPEAHEQSVQNVSAAWQHATPEQKNHDWYAHARVQTAELAKDVPYSAGRPHERAAAAVARLSPSGGGMDWEKNIPAAKDAAKLSGDQVDAISRNDRSSLRNSPLKHASNSDITRAHAVLHGDAEPEGILTTQKIGHFYGNIRGDANMRQAAKNYPDAESAPLKQTTTNKKTGQKDVKYKTEKFYDKVDPAGATIDGRADSIVKGRHVAWGTSIGLGTQGRYDYESGVYKDAAARHGVSAKRMQSATWTVGEQAGYKGSKSNRKVPGEPLDYTQGYSAGSAMKSRHQKTVANRRDNAVQNATQGQQFYSKMTGRDPK